MKKVKAVLIATVITIFISFVLLSLAALIVSKTALLPEGLLPVVTTLLCCIAALGGGHFASMIIKEKGILYGFLTAAIFVIVLFSVSFILSPAPFGVAGVGKICAILISGAIGGILGANRKEKVKF